MPFGEVCGMKQKGAQAMTTPGFASRNDDSRRLGARRTPTLNPSPQGGGRHRRSAPSAFGGSIRAVATRKSMLRFGKCLATTRGDEIGSAGTDEMDRHGKTLEAEPVQARPRRRRPPPP